MTDTIAAISTSIGEAGIGIVRMSGKDSLALGKKVFKGKTSEIENRKLSYGHIVDDGGKVRYGGNILPWWNYCCF